MLGSLGSVVFETSIDRIRTFDNLKRQGKARFATHELVDRKPSLQFTGLDLDTLSFDMRFDVSLGLNPLKELKSLREIRDKGEAVDFILNGQPIGENLWVIESIDENLDVIDNKGNILVATVSVQLKEYPEVLDG